MFCTDRCHHHKAIKPRVGSRYALGQKYCSHCAVFIKWDGIRCPCCGLQLKYKSKDAKYKLEVKRI